MQPANRMKTPGTALELLTSQHDEVDELIEAIESSDDDEKAEIFAELADKLAAHSATEEKLFYPWVHTRQTEALVLEAAEEHLAIKRVLADLVEMSVDDPQFDAKLAVMKEQIRHHARDEEEDELFPKVRRLASREELEALGAEMLAFFEEQVATEPRTRVKDETAEAARV